MSASEGSPFWDALEHAARVDPAKDPEHVCGRGHGCVNPTFTIMVPGHADTTLVIVVQQHEPGQTPRMAFSGGMPRDLVPELLRAVADRLDPGR